MPLVPQPQLRASSLMQLMMLQPGKIPSSRQEALALLTVWLTACPADVRTQRLRALQHVHRMQPAAQEHAGGCPAHGAALPHAQSAPPRVLKAPCGTGCEDREGWHGAPASHAVQLGQADRDAAAGPGRPLQRQGPAGLRHAQQQVHGAAQGQQSRSQPQWCSPQAGPLRGAEGGFARLVPQAKYRCTNTHRKIP